MLRLSSKNSCEGVESLLDDEEGLIGEVGAIGGKDKDLVALLKSFLVLLKILVGKDLLAKVVFSSGDGVADAVAPSN